jgi:predicted dehydrogenase
MDASKKITVGVIGVGHLGSLHAKMYSQIPSADLVGVYDIDRGRAETVATEMKTSVYDSMKGLLENVQAVSVVTPTRTHFDIAREVISSGIHAFIEKPITQSVDEAQQLIDLARQGSVKVQIGHIERFNPALLALKGYQLHPMFIESHRLAQFNPRGTDVAVVLDLMIHDIDIIVSLVRSPIRQIDANGVAVVSDTIDIANARLQFENGCVANVTASRISQKKMRKMRLFQRDAYISIDFLEGAAEVFRLVEDGHPSAHAGMMLGQIDAGRTKHNIVYEQPAVLEVNALRFELESFLDAIAKNTEPIVTAGEGKQALLIAHEIMKKIQQQKLVL